MKVRRQKSVARSLLSVGVVLAMLAALLAACSSGSNEAKGSASSSPAASGSGSPAGSGAKSAPVKITVGITANPNVEDYETNYYTKMIEAAMNVDLEFMLLPSNANEAKTKLALMISSGEQLPDVLNLYLDSTTVYDYASKGVLVKLDDYYKDASMAVHFNQIPEKDYIYKHLRLPDGGVYSLPRYIPQDWNEGPNRAWINTEWLEKLSLQVPKTTDELYNVLKAFAEQDPNGNSKKDEVGIVGSKDGWAQRPMVFLMNSFIDANPDRSYFYLKDGKVAPAFTQPEWKQGLEYMNKLVKEGLFSPLSFTQDQTQMKALINVKGGMAGIVASGSYSSFNSDVLGNAMTLLGPVQGPNGIAYSPRNPTMPDKLWFITKDAKDPELAFKVGDFMLSQETSMTSRYGEKGADWSDDPAVTSQFIGNFEESEGLKPKWAVLNSKIWNNPQNKHWNDMAPAYRSNEDTKLVAQVKKDDEAPASPNWQPAYAKQYAPAFPKDPIPSITYTPDELNKIANNKTAIDQYVNESAVAFITGNKPLSQWDGYLKELDKMGLDVYVEATQAAFDRTQ